jgi:hypothetical protein
MCTAQGPCEAGWRQQDLPESCPPSKAKSTSGERLFRNIYPEGPTERDFVPVAISDPSAWSDRPECVRRAISLRIDEQSARALLLLPANHGMRVAVVHLEAGAGVTAKSKSNKVHVRWWRCGAYDAVSHTTAVG